VSFCSVGRVSKAQNALLSRLAGCNSGCTCERSSSWHVILDICLMGPGLFRPMAFSGEVSQFIAIVALLYIGCLALGVLLQLGGISCYRLSKRLNCFCGTCSGLGTWRPRCTRDASSRTRHVVPIPFLSLITLVTVLLNGGASPMTPASSMTHASVPVPVPFPQLSPHVRSYHPIIPSPCTLGQQVIALLSQLIVLPRLVYLSVGS